PRGGQRRPRSGAGETDPRGQGRGRHPGRRRRRDPHSRVGARRHEGRRRRRRHGDDHRGGPRGGRPPQDHRRGEGGVMHVFRAKTAGESHAETTRIARRLFVSPPPQRMVLPIVAFSLMESYLLVYPGLDGFRVLLGGAAVGVPAFLAALATVPVADRLGGRMYFRRSFLLAFVGLMIVGAFELVATVALTLYSLVTGVPYLQRIDRVTVLGYGAVFWSRQVILSATSNSKHLHSLPAASLHPVLGLIGLAAVLPFRLDEVVLALVAYAVFFGTAVAYTEIAKRPLLRS